MTETVSLLVFSLDSYRYALFLPAVERVVPVVETTPLPRAPEIVGGLIDYQGTVLPVLNIRERFRLPGRERELSDQLILAHTARRLVALEVDSVHGVIDYHEDDVAAAENIVPATQYVESVLRLADGLVLIHDLDGFLSLGEEEVLDAALEQRSGVST